MASTERAIVLVCTTLLLAGCFVTRPGGKLAPLPPEPASSIPTLEVTVGDWRLEPTEYGWDMAGGEGRRLNKALLGRWQEQGLISGHSAVKDSRFSEDARYRLTLNGLKAREGVSGWNVLAIPTLIIAPIRMRDTLDLRYSLRDAETGCVFDARVRGSYRTTRELFLIFALPIALRGVNETYDRVAEHVWARLNQQGAFDPHPPCVSDAADG
jgi:hypothetical protein